jgi:hypothetical protein
VRTRRTSLIRAGVPALSMWVRLVVTARIPSSVTEKHSLRWNSVSAVRPATAQTSPLTGTHDGMQSSLVVPLRC